MDAPSCPNFVATSEQLFKSGDFTEIMIGICSNALSVAKTSKHLAFLRMVLRFGVNYRLELPVSFVTREPQSLAVRRQDTHHAHGSIHDIRRLLFKNLNSLKLTSFLSYNNYLLT